MPRPLTKREKNWGEASKDSGLVVGRPLRIEYSGAFCPVLSLIFLDTLIPFFVYSTRSRAIEQRFFAARCGAVQIVREVVIVVEKRTGARFLAETLKGYGVTHVFFVEAILRKTLVELETLGVRRILAHSEKAAAYMADGYARITKRPGICMAQSVGAANLASGLQDPYLGSSPVIAFTGKKPPLWQNRNSYQEIDHAPLFAAVTKYNVTVDAAEQLPFYVRQAFREATTGRPRPVHLDISGGYTGGGIESTEGNFPVIVEERFLRFPAFRPEAESETIRQAVALLRNAERPVIVAGGGARSSEAGPEIAALAEGLSIPVATSLDGKDILALQPEELRKLRSDMQMIFQDPDAALNPKMRVRDILKESITVHHKINGGEVDKKIGQLLEQVNLKENKLCNFPYELSGGEKRRVGLARALSVGARFIVADEPTSALDVSIQAQVVNLLRDLQKQLGLSYLFISHDLRVVELISHKVAVMYLGKIVEMGVSEHIANGARHPYTHILWSSLVGKQSREASRASRNVQAGQWGVFDFERPVAGCRFAPRCPVYEAMGRPPVCTDPATEPQLRNLGAGHYAACHFPL